MQLGFYFDQTRCTGCHTCAVACKDWNDIPAGPVHWRQILAFEEGEWPRLFAAYLSDSCNHCRDPLCLDVCPARAISKQEEDGIVLVDPSKCREAASCGIISNHLEIPFGEMKSPCTLACPAGVNVQGLVGLIGAGRFREAMELIRRDLPLPSVCGRACTHPCESACSRGKLDESIAIMELKRFAAEQVVPLPQLLPVTKRQKVAVIGSGPAGLSAAWGLTLRGYRVTVFEALETAGGMLAVGLPEYRLPKRILQRDLDYLMALGTEIRTNTPIGQNLKIEELKAQGYEAVFLAAGAHLGLKPSIPGSDLEGVLVGVSFLREVRLGKRSAIGSRVLVVGGGRVALDCARTAFRLGATDVRVICLEGVEMMRAGVEEIAEAQAEGVVIHHGQTAIRIFGQGGKVNAVGCLDVKAFHFDESGRVQVETSPGPGHIHETDAVIFAVGQSPAMHGLPDLNTWGAGSVSVDPSTFATAMPGLFAGGEISRGPISIVEAIAEGKRAAASIDAYLQGFIYKPRVELQGISPTEIEVRIPPGTETRPRRRPGRSPNAVKCSWDESTQTFSAEEAVAEAKRCLNCAGHLCREVCPTRAPQFGADHHSKMQKCDLCADRWRRHRKPVCVAACPTRALDAGPLDELIGKYGDQREAEGFAHSPLADPSIRFKPKKFKGNIPDGSQCETQNKQKE